MIFPTRVTVATIESRKTVFPCPRKCLAGQVVSRRSLQALTVAEYLGPCAIQRQLLIQSGVAMLLYLVKHTRPEIANAVRELSKALDCPSPVAYKEMLCVIKHLLDTKNLGIQVALVALVDNEWLLVTFSDSDFGGDKETRASVAGFILYLMGVPISWQSKGQKSVGADKMVQPLP